MSGEASRPTPTPIDLAQYGVDRLFLAASLENFGEPFKKTLGNLAEEPGYYVWGKEGRGKTYLAAAIFRHWIVSGRASRTRQDYFKRSYVSARWYFVPDLMARIRDTWDKKGASERPIMRELLRAEAVVLDNMTVAHFAPWALERLFTIIDKRYNNGLPTVVTSTLSTVQIAEHDPSLASRLGGWKVIEVRGHDRRLDKES